MRFILLTLLFTSLVLLGNDLESRNILSKYFSSDFVIDIERSYEFKQRNKKQNEYYSICKGVIIAPTKIITSGDCFDVGDSMYKTAYRNLTIKHKNTRYVINNIYKHKDYNKHSLANNIALLELDEPIELSKYPTFISKKSLLDMISNKQKAHLLFQNKENAIIQSVIPMSSSSCNNISKTKNNDSVLCMHSVGKNITLCPSFQGSPITRVKDDGNIELVGVVVKPFKSGCGSVQTLFATNVAVLDYFLDSKEYYVQDGSLTRGYIKSLSSGWHFLGTQEKIDNSLSYILDYGKEIYMYENKTNSYIKWTKTNNKWNNDILILARRGFWLKR